MEIAIAILLALILVAMVSSNKDAANGVWKVVRWAGIGGLLFLAWMVLILYAVWFYTEYQKGDWERGIGIGAAVLIPPVLIFINWKIIRSSFAKDKRAAIKWTAIFSAYVIGLMFLAAFYQEVSRTVPYFGWYLLSFAIFFTGVILTWRKLTWPKGSYVWFLPPSLPGPWAVVYDKEIEYSKAIDDEWEAMQEKREAMPEAEYEIFAKGLRDKTEANRLELQALRTELDAEYAAREKARNAMSFATVFWFAIFFSACGLIGIGFDYAHEYAMTLDMVKGRSWFATFMVILIPLGVVGIAWSILEDIGKKKTS